MTGRGYRYLRSFYSLFFLGSAPKEKAQERCDRYCHCRTDAQPKFRGCGIGDVISKQSCENVQWHHSHKATDQIYDEVDSASAEIDADHVHGQTIYRSEEECHKVAVFVSILHDFLESGILCTEFVRIFGSGKSSYEIGHTQLQRHSYGIDDKGDARREKKSHSNIQHKNGENYTETFCRVKRNKERRRQKRIVRCKIQERINGKIRT